MSTGTAIAWLRLAIVATAALGIVLVTTRLPTVGDLLAIAIGFITAPGAAVAPLTTSERMLSAIGGGVLIGWAWLAWHVTATQIVAGDRRGAVAVLVSLLAWFVTDSGGSIAAGAPLNAAVNVAFLIVFLPPLTRLMRASDHRDA